MVHEASDGGLVRHGDVEALAARALKLADCLLQLVGGDLQQLVLHLLAGLQGEETVDHG